jgi:hypothetical protein
MVRCSAGAVTILSFVMAMTPALAGDTLDLSLPTSVPSEGTHPTPPMTLSLGTVGVRSSVGDPYRAVGSDARNYFEIPSERSAASGTGFLIRIPLEDQSQ